MEKGTIMVLKKTGSPLTKHNFIVTNNCRNNEYKAYLLKHFNNNRMIIFFSL